MALKVSDIKVEAYVHVGDKLVNVDELPPDLKVRFATELSITYLNELYKGKAKFFVAGEKPESDGEKLAGDPWSPSTPALEGRGLLP